MARWSGKLTALSGQSQHHTLVRPCCVYTWWRPPLLCVYTVVSAPSRMTTRFNKAPSHTEPINHSQQNQHTDQTKGKRYSPKDKLLHYMALGYKSFRERAGGGGEGGERGNWQRERGDGGGGERERERERERASLL